MSSSILQTLLDKADAIAKSSGDEMSSVASAERRFPSESETAQAFAGLRQKIFQINRWNSHSILTSFEIFDETGNAGKREKAAIGDFIRVSMTGTGKSDWVKITRIDEIDSPEEIVLTVQPTFDPTADAPDKTVTSHFFKSKSSNNFCLQKKGETISFYVVGLNEESNTGNTKNIIETARNVAAANLGHYLGIQKAEWTAFCKNFLEKGN